MGVVEADWEAVIASCISSTSVRCLGGDGGLSCLGRSHEHGISGVYGGTGGILSFHWKLGLVRMGIAG